MKIQRRLPGLAFFVVALSGVAAGCTSPAEEPVVAQRWIATAPADELRVSQLQGLDCAYETAFEGGRPPAGLVLEAGDLQPGSGKASITLIGWKSPPRLRLQRRWEPGELDAARLTLAGLRRGSVRLRWFESGVGEPAGALDLTRAEGGGTLHDSFFFDLAERLPTDRTVELEIEPTTVGGEIVTLSGLCVGRARLDSQRVDAASRVAWKATLGDEARDVLVQPPGGSIARKFALPNAASLAVGFGRLAGHSSGVRLRVLAEGAGEPSLVLVDRLLVAEELAGGWIDLDVDLSRVGSGEHRLVLAASPDPDSDPSFIGVWSAPRVISLPGRAARPNIVLISLDTLRADHLSLYGYPRETSPRLDAWARSRKAAVFNRVVPSSGWTLPSHFSLFTGLNAFRHPANYDTVAIDSSAFNFLAERLLSAGYRTQAFTGGGFLHPIYGLAKGFESFSYWTDQQRRPEELTANLVRVGKWLDRIAATGKTAPGVRDPFLLFLHTYEIHAPYMARQPYFGNFSQLPANLIVDFLPDGDRVQRGFLGTFHIQTRTAPEAPGEPLAPSLAALPAALYDSKISYVDEQLAPLLRRLSEPPFGSNTVVVLFSDHGESLGEDGLASHANLSLSNLLVPLIVVTPGAKQARQIPTQVRLIDLYPTILEIAGVEVPKEIDGQTLRGLLAGGAEPAGRTAWAYAASTNFGLSLLAPDGLKLDWRNSLWKPIAGDLRWFTREGFRETGLDQAPATPEAEQMVRQIQQVYGREANGLSFRLQNLTSHAVRVSIVSDLVDPVAVKSPRVESAGLDWGHMGAMEATLAAGSTLDLRFERTERREIELQIEVAAEDCSSQIVTTAVSASADQFRQSQRWHIKLPACAEGEGEAAIRGLELEVAWHGPLPSASGARSDEALRKDLAALGYLH